MGTAVRMLSCVSKLTKVLVSGAPPGKRPEFFRLQVAQDANCWFYAETEPHRRPGISRGAAQRITCRTMVLAAKLPGG